MTRKKKTYQRGSVKLHNGVWTLRYRELDRRTGEWTNKRERLGEFKTKRDAQKVAEPIMARVNERNNSDQPLKVQEPLTFRRFIETRWKAYTVQAGHQPSTTDSHNSLIKCHLLPFFGEMKLADVQPGDISDFFDARRGAVLREGKRKKISANTLQHLYGLLHLMFELAEQYDLIERSPVRPKLHKPEMPSVKKPTLNAAQLRAVIEAFNERERLLVVLLALTGMRVGEAQALRWMDFDAEGLELSINHTVYRQKLKGPKTKGSRRFFRVIPAVADWLVTHRQQSAFAEDGDYIFCRRDGRPLNRSALRNHIGKAMEAVGIKQVKGQHGFHIFRHSAGTLLYIKTRDLKLVQGTLGHADISTTSDIYVHLDDRIVTEGMGILAAEILGIRTPTAPQVSQMVS